MSVTLQINGEAASVDAALHDTLLSVLREQLQLHAAKRGCNQGVCGACTVNIDGWPARACLSLAHGCEGAQVRTRGGIERRQLGDRIARRWESACRVGPGRRPGRLDVGRRCFRRGRGRLSDPRRHA